MSTAVAADSRAADLWSQFRTLAAERKHNLSPDMLTRSATIPQLERMISFLGRQPVKADPDAIPSGRRAAARKPLSSQAIPDGRYAIPGLTENNKLDFFELKTNQNKSSTWCGTQFIQQLVGQPGSDYAKYDVRGSQKRNTIFRAIREAGIEASRDLAADELRMCLDCGSPLSDDDSRARRRGSHCYSKFMKGSR
jgi:hypothetical protein